MVMRGNEFSLIQRSFCTAVKLRNPGNACKTVNDSSPEDVVIALGIYISFLYMYAYVSRLILSMVFFSLSYCCRGYFLSVCLFNVELQ